MQPFIQHTKTHLITGFLGSGKTSFINFCIEKLNKNQKWAILVNEVGKIGIDKDLFSKQQNLAIQQVSGGCICCTSQLPLQIALSRLLSDHQPDCLWIEPTGLAHPKELIEQLSAPHWQTALSMQSVISILNAKQWQDIRYRQHDNYQAHMQFCDVVVINRFDELLVDDISQLTDWIYQLNPSVSIFWQGETGLDDKQLNNLWQQLPKKSAILSQSTSQIFRLNQQNFSNKVNETSDNHELPYRYHDKQGDYHIIGWRLPSHWQIQLTQLLDFLLNIPHWQRIKSVVHTTDGWQKLNFTPDSLDMLQTDIQSDNRIEVIFLHTRLSDDEILQIQQQLLALFQQP